MEKQLDAVVDGTFKVIAKDLSKKKAADLYQNGSKGRKKRFCGGQETAAG